MAIAVSEVFVSLQMTGTLYFPYTKTFSFKSLTYLSFTNIYPPQSNPHNP